MQAPDDLRKKARKRWPEILKALATAEPLEFPWRLALGSPKGTELLSGFQEVIDWAKSLREMAARTNLELVETTIRHRQLGEQRVPSALVVQDLRAYLSWVGLSQVYDQIIGAVAETLAHFPKLQPWLQDHMPTLERHLAIWPTLLQVLRTFVATPRPGCHVRELDAPGVDSKFVENHRYLLDQLLVILLPTDTFEQDQDVSTLGRFCAKFGLKADQPLIRWRWLDSELATATAGLVDLSTPVTDFCQWSPTAVEVVIITENKASGLSFPAVKRGMVIFGLGYGVESLAAASWLGDRRILYWGDIDTHGFAILARLRCHFPQVESLLMDESTFLTGRPYWVTEETQAQTSIDGSLLTTAEAVVLASLFSHQHGKALRLEQEKIPLRQVAAALAEAGP